MIKKQKDFPEERAFKRNLEGNTSISRSLGEGKGSAAEDTAKFPKQESICSTRKGTSVSEAGRLERVAGDEAE